MTKDEFIDFYEDLDQYDKFKVDVLVAREEERIHSERIHSIQPQVIENRPEPMNANMFNF